MDNLKVSFRLGSIEFNDLTQISEPNQEMLKQVFLPWEKRMMQTSAIHFINNELNMDSTKKVSVILKSKIES